MREFMIRLMTLTIDEIVEIVGVAAASSAHGGAPGDKQ